MGAGVGEAVALAAGTVDVYVTFTTLEETKVEVWT